MVDPTKMVLVGVDVGENLPRSLRQAVQAMPGVLEEAIKLLRESGEDRAGGYLSIAIARDSPLVLRMPFGTMLFCKAVKYSELSVEKLIRLLGSDASILTSYDTRDPVAEIILSTGESRPWGRWGGAIRVPSGGMILEDAISFSGLPELWDEALMFALAIKLEWLPQGAVLKQISADRNPHLRLLLDALH